MSKRRGTTLIELLLVMGIASVIMVSVGYLIRTGVDYYFYSTTQLEVQRSSLLSLNILTQELTGSTYESVYTDNNLPNPGFVFAISETPDGGVQRSPSGNLEWTKMVAYYIDEIDGTKMLIRKKSDLATPHTSNPPDTVGLGYDIAFFRSLADPGRIMARHISKVETEELTDALRITMTAEINEGRNWLEMDVSTSIVPRN
ncbi:MAG: prepilin-type N-terminal cleavage/methylation domain-containing protein [Candidatus Eremiobacteraeota bacterium]|nr:prepilin-type N-terminal cleavage/methylation domain-containing protein [Candidatus Eremiobacteraeota bacterium]